jgi:hypothetical protein
MLFPSLCNEFFHLCQKEEKKLNLDVRICCAGVTQLSTAGDVLIASNFLFGMAGR